MKKINFIVIIFIFGVLLNGCGNVSDSTLKEDFVSHIGRDIELEEFEIVKSATEDSEYYANIQVTYNDGYYQMLEEYDMYYYKYNEGWMLDDIFNCNKRGWTIIPINGVSNTVLIDSLSNCILTLDETDYHVGAIDENSINVLSQKTDLDYYIDNLVVSYSFEDDYLEYNVEVQVIFSFIDDTWEVTSLDVNKLTYTLKQNYQFEKSVEQLLTDINAYSFKDQTQICATDLEVLDSSFDISSFNYIVNTICTMTYDIATVNANVTFNYKIKDNEWEIKKITIGEVISYENDILSGTYKGTIGKYNQYEQEIQIVLDTEKFGAVTGQENTIHHSSTKDVNYSLYHKGSVNFSENTVKTRGYEWIVDPGRNYLLSVAEYTFDPETRTLTIGNSVFTRIQ